MNKLGPLAAITAFVAALGCLLFPFVALTTAWGKMTGYLPRGSWAGINGCIALWLFCLLVLKWFGLRFGDVIDMGPEYRSRPPGGD